MTKQSTITALAISSMMMIGAASAQTTDAKNEKQFRLKIITNENGNIKNIDTTFADESALNAFVEKENLDVPEPPEVPAAPNDVPSPPTPPDAPLPPDEPDFNINISGDFLSKEEMQDLKKDLEDARVQMKEAMKNMKDINFDININDDKDAKGKSKHIVIKSFGGDKDSFSYSFNFPDCQKMCKELKEKMKGKNFNFNINDEDNDDANAKHMKHHSKKIIIIENNSKTKDAKPADEKNKNDNEKKGKDAGSGKQEASNYVLEPSTFSLSPNPGNGKYNLHFTLDNMQPVEVKIMSLGGNVVFADAVNDFSGTYNKELNIEGKSKGSYLLQIKQGDRWMHKEFLLQ